MKKPNLYSFNIEFNYRFILQENNSNMKLCEMTEKPQENLFLWLIFS